MDSRWRYLEIAYEKVIDLPTISGVTPVFTHGLGFLPAFDCYNITLDRYVNVGDITGGGLVSSKDAIYFNGTGAGGNPDYSNTQVLLRVYNLPITDEYLAPIDQTLPSATATPSSEGIRITAGTADMSEKELSRFSMNTNGKSLAVQRTGLATANSGTNNLAIINHALGYPPTFLAAYADIRLQWVGVINPSSLPASSSADGNNLVLRGGQAALVGTFAYIIFKELADFAL